MAAAVVVVAGVVVAVVVMVVIGVERVAQVVVADAEAVGGGQCSAHFGPVAGFAEGLVVRVEGVAVAEGGECHRRSPWVPKSAESPEPGLHG